MAKTFRQLTEDEKCDKCSATIVKVGGCYFCQNCQDELSPCLFDCDGIAHNGPYELIDEQLREAKQDGDGFCDKCGNGWEWA